MVANDLGAEHEARLLVASHAWRAPLVAAARVDRLIAANDVEGALAADRVRRYATDMLAGLTLVEQA